VDGKDLRRAPIEERKGTLAKLLRHPHAGIAYNQHGPKRLARLFYGERFCTIELRRGS
jgi:hypothetical protein